MRQSSRSGCAFATSTACRTGIGGRQERDRGRHAIRSGRLRTRPDPAERRRDPRAAARDVGPRTSLQLCDPRSPLPVANYRATLRLRRVSDGNRTFAEWSASFDADPPEKQAETEDFISNAVFQGGFDALNKHFGGLIASGFAAAVTTAATPLVIRPRASAPPARQCPSVRRSGRSDARMSRLRCRPERRAGRAFGRACR